MRGLIDTGNHARDTCPMGTVVVVGSLNVDLVVGLDRMPDPGETVMGRTLDQHAGGKGLNQAVAAARLGAHVEMIGAVGSDDSGAWLRSIVTGEGIGDAAVRTVDGPSGTALIEVDRTGMNRIVVVPGANGQVSPDDVAAALGDIDDLAIVLTQGEVPLASIEAAMVVGKARGARTILNPAPVLDYPVELLRAVDIVLPNEHEAAQLTGIETSTLEGAQAAAAHLVSLGVSCAIITRCVTYVRSVDAIIVTDYVNAGKGKKRSRVVTERWQLPPGIGAEQVNGGLALTKDDKRLDVVKSGDGGWAVKTATSGSSVGWHTGNWGERLQGAVLMRELRLPKKASTHMEVTVFVPRTTAESIPVTINPDSVTITRGATTVTTPLPRP